MAFRIPDSPNIIGGQTVLREPDKISATTVVPNAVLDTRTLQNAVADWGNYVSDRIRVMNDTMLSDAKREWIQNITAERDDVVNKYKGKNAQDLYARVLRKASDKITNDILGPDKNDGKTRIRNAALQRQFRDWVNGQQSSLISFASNYENQEWNHYANSVYDARKVQAGELIVNARTPEEIVNGLNAFNEILHVQNSGLGEAYVQDQVASAVETPMIGYISKLSVSDPIHAAQFLWLHEKSFAIARGEDGTLRYFSDYISQNNQAELAKSIRESYENKAVDEMSYGRGTQYINAQNISLVYGTSDPAQIAAIKEDLQGKAKKRADERAEAAAGVQAQMEYDAISNLITAEDSGNDQQYQEALMNAYNVNPALAIAQQKADEEELAFMKTQKDMERWAPDYSERRDRLPEIKEEAREQAVKQVGSVNSTKYAIDNAEKAIEKGMTREQYIDSVLKDKDDESSRKQFGEDYDVAVRAKELTDAELYAGYQLFAPDIIRRYEDYMAMVAPSATAFIKFDNEISTTGSLSDWTTAANTLTGHDYKNLQRHAAAMGRAMALKNKYPNIENLLSDTDAQYKNLDAPSKTLALNNILSDINAYEKAHGGNGPSKAELSQIVSNSYRNSRSKAAMLVDKSSVRNVDSAVSYLAAKGIDPVLSPKEAREVLEDVDMLSGKDVVQQAISKQGRYYKKTASNTFDSAMKKYDSVIDDIIDELGAKGKRAIENQREVLRRALMAGDIQKVYNIVDQFVEQREGHAW